MSWAFLILAMLMSVLASPDGVEPRERESQGSVFVYLQPFDQEAARLQFEVASLAALSEDGTPAPIAVSLRHVAGAEIDRQRRLAAGPVPRGRYSALTLKVTGATLTGKQGEAALISPSGPVEIPVPFTVDRNQALVLWLRIDLRQSVGEGYRFSPVFTAGAAIPPPVARLGLASSPEEGDVCFFDRLSREIVAFVLTGRGPRGMALDSRRQRVYVALSDDDQVIAIGLPEQHVVERLRMQGGDEPTELALTPDGEKLLSANAGSRSMSIIDTRSFVELERVTVGDRPRSVLVDPGGSRAWVFNTAASSLSVVDLARSVVVGAVATEGEPFRGQFNRRGDLLYVVHRRAPYLTVIDPGSLSEQRRILLGTPATALKVDPRTDLIYVTPKGGSVIEVYDPISFLPVDSLPSGGEVAFLALDGDENRLHAALTDPVELRSYALAGKKIAFSMDVGAESYWISLVGER